MPALTENKTRTYSRVALGLTFFLFLCILLLSFADQSLLSPLLNPLLQDFFNATNNVVPLGWVTFVFTLLTALSMIAAGILGDRKSRKKICFTGLIIYSVFSMMTILVPHGQAGYVFFFITRALNGVGIGAIVPTIFSMVGDTVHSKRRATAFGYVSASIIIGRLIGFFVAGSLADQWRLAYFSLGVTSFLLAFGLLMIREPKRGSQERELRDVLLEGAEYRFRISRKDIKTLRSAKSNFWLIINFIDVFPGAIIIFLIFKYMEDIHNMAVGAVNFVIFLVVIAAAAGALIFGRLGDWGFQKDKRARALVAMACNIVPVLFMVIFVSAEFWIPEGVNLRETLAVPGVWPVVAAILAAMFINQGVNPNWYSSLTDVNLPEHRATMISLASVMDMIGMAVGPLIASFMATAWGLRTAMWAVLVFWILNIFLWIPVIRFIRGDLSRIHDVLQERAKEISSAATSSGVEIKDIRSDNKQV
ncbi:MFS transporter [Acidobacteriota bacterium]